MTRLPVDDALPALAAALAGGTSAVLQAPPGAGKTTRVPLVLREAPWLGGRKIVMLEPRRVAARAAATWMSRTLGEPVGHAVGYRTRLDTRVGRDTVIEVVTEGILTRMLVSDPALEDVGLVIFDEFHERNLHADEGLALTLAMRRALRPDLRILVMSATLDGERVAALLGDAPVITSQGTSFPVALRYLPPREGRRIEESLASAVRLALDETGGDILAFLPGAGEIRRAGELLGDLESSRVTITPLHGTLPPSEQDRALEPDPRGRRKVILATSIAESSVTIDGVRVVVDAGLSRSSRFSPRTGLTRLVTTRVSRASSEQRAGRAGRQASGTAYRLWAEREQGMLAPYSAPEIVEADLAPLVLDLAAAGFGSAEGLEWLDAPPPAHLAQARDLLASLGAIAPDGALTSHGRVLSGTGLHPRLAHMLVEAERIGARPVAAIVAALLEERDILRSEGGPPDPDLRIRVEAVMGHGVRGIVRGGLERVKEMAHRRRGAEGAKKADVNDVGLVAALGFPDRIAQRREGSARFLLRNGRGAVLAVPHALASAEFIVALDLDDQGSEGRIFLAAPLTREEIEEHFGSEVTQVERVDVSDDGIISARRTRQLGAIVLDESVVRDPDPVELGVALRQYLGRTGLGALDPDGEHGPLRARLAFLHAHDPSWPSMDDAALVEQVLERLSAEGSRIRRVSELGALLSDAIVGQLDWNQRGELDRLAPTHVEVPTGSRIAVNYDDPLKPVLAVRLQEMFGAAATPAIMGGRVPLTLHLLSPAHRPLQVTQDLAGFWRTSYAEVRKEMRGRYPRHEWPEDPATATPTRRAKPRRR